METRNYSINYKFKLITTAKGNEGASRTSIIEYTSKDDIAEIRSHNLTSLTYIMRVFHKLS